MRRLVSVFAATILAALPLVGAAPSEASSVHKVEVVQVSFSPPGPDYPITNRKLNKEYAVIKNSGATVRNLGGWTLSDDSGHVYTFHHARLGPGHVVFVLTGSGTDTHRVRYWGRRHYAWNNHDAATLKNRAGIRVAVFKY
jgi:hypothetical protein